jgi:hypothetical protein
MGKGLSKPKHMSNEEYAEYKFTSAEAKEELSGFDYSQFDEPDHDNDHFDSDLDEVWV